MYFSPHSNYLVSIQDDGDTITSNNYRHYIFAPDLSGPGLSDTDQLTLPYPTVLGFEYLLSKIPPEVNEMFDAALEVHPFTKCCFICV